MTKISFITDEASQQPREFIALARNYQVDAVELRSVLDKHCMHLSRDERATLKNQLRDAGLGVCCIGSAAFKAELDDPLQAELDKLEQCLELASYLGAPYVRIFSFWRRRLGPADESVLLAALERAADIAEAAGMTLLIENGKRSIHATGAELAHLLQTLARPNVAALWDTGNSVYGRTDFDPLGAGYARLSTHIRHVHLKQVHRAQDGQLYYGPFRQGLIDIAHLLTQLAQDGYDGYVSVETHWRSADTWQPAHRFSEHQLDYPGGAAFSRGGYDATAESLAHLRRLALEPA